MRVKILGKGSSAVLASYLCNSGWELDKYDYSTNTAYCHTSRRGRSDEEIDRKARESRIAFAVVLTFQTGVFICPNFRYKVVD